MRVLLDENVPVDILPVLRSASLGAPVYFAHPFISLMGSAYRINW
jgi:hypothetical protein